MDDWLKELRKRAPGDRAVRFMVLGGTALLVLIVLVDAFGARERAIAARANPPAEETVSATVPSVYRVPRDLASEAAASARDVAVAETTDDTTDDTATELAEADTTDAAAEPELAEDATQQDTAAEDATEDAAEPEVAEADPAEDATQDMAAEETTESVAEPELAEDATEDATQDMAAEDMAADDATEQAAETDLAETTPEDAPADTTAAAATDDDALVLLADADISNGESVWRQCRACHVHDAEQNRGGPHLVNIIGREVGVAEGWRYSNALSDHDGVWTVESLLAWLENPDTYIPGNQMAFRGLRNEQDRIDVLGFLNASAD
ncbi:c-type cytochrome [Roseinatronobacter monicus]|uniref:Cytochrome c2 n=1 Tax=Roseinatronobacter monicus TaxID=393481 RepID=A0A543KFV6_9RHOB|nr:hypothetical protein [Roseinatronobacter monicus]TQM93954.1 cytochrome c2 [Roseinatronobacter monicus]